VSEKRMECMFFNNGNTAFFYQGEQQPDLQKSWFRMYVDFLLIKGVDPTDVKFILPNGKKAKIIKTPEGIYEYNWAIS